MEVLKRDNGDLELNTRRRDKEEGKEDMCITPREEEEKKNMCITPRG